MLQKTVCTTRDGRKCQNDGVKCQQCPIPNSRFTSPWSPWRSARDTNPPGIARAAVFAKSTVITTTLCEICSNPTVAARMKAVQYHHSLPRKADTKVTLQLFQQQCISFRMAASALGISGLSV